MMLRHVNAQWVRLCMYKTVVIQLFSLVLFFTSKMMLQIKQLAEEIIAHIRDVAGADALVSAFTAAKKAVSAVRSERKRRSAVQVCLCWRLCCTAQSVRWTLASRCLDGLGGLAWNMLSEVLSDTEVALQLHVCLCILLAGVGRP